MSGIRPQTEETKMDETTKKFKKACRNPKLKAILLSLACDQTFADAETFAKQLNYDWHMQGVDLSITAYEVKMLIRDNFQWIECDANEFTGIRAYVGLRNTIRAIAFSL
jgi:hypothetical protein